MNSRALRFRQLSSYVITAGCLAAAISPSLRAEEKAPYMNAAGYGFLLASASVRFEPTPVTPLSQWFAEPPAAVHRPEALELTDDTRTLALFQSTTSDEKTGDDAEVVLVRAKLGSRYAYEAWAGLHTGYGQFLPEDKLGRSRFSGAGIKDPDWFYVKLSFRF